MPSFPNARGKNSLREDLGENRNMGLPAPGVPVMAAEKRNEREPAGEPSAGGQARPATGRRQTNQRNLTEAILTTVRHPLLGLDADLRVRTAKPDVLTGLPGLPRADGQPSFVRAGQRPVEYPEPVNPAGAGPPQGQLPHAFLGSACIRRPRPPHDGAQCPKPSYERITGGTSSSWASRTSPSAGEPSRHCAMPKTTPREIVETVREPLLVLDPSLRVMSANESFYRTFQGHPLRDPGPAPL